MLINDNYLLQKLLIMWHSSDTKNYLGIGKENQNCEPFLGAFLTPTSPFRLLTRFLTIAKPRPLPFFSDAMASAVRKNLSKIRSLSSSEIPLPLSVTVTMMF